LNYNKKHKKTIYTSSIKGVTTIVMFSIFSFISFSQIEPVDSLYRMSLSELMKLKVVAPSGVLESAKDAPAAMVIITREEINQRGYTDLSEVLLDLPGFDNSVTNGTYYHVGYQRGYRTSSMQRTLFMINGITGNHLWTHDADISRQIPISNIERIEIVYGPTSAVYGPNAFLGVINVVTRDGKSLAPNTNETTLSLQYGSNNTLSYDVSTLGNTDKVSYSFSHKLFQSNDPNLEGKWGFVTNEMYSDTTTWGPILDLEHRNQKFGSYNDPANDLGFIGNISYDKFKLGLITWKTDEGYGPIYAADRAQNSSSWNKSSLQFYFQHSTDITTRLHSELLILYRESRSSGKWAEAEPDFDDSVIPNDTIFNGNEYEVTENFRDYSYISYTDWNSNSNSKLIKEKIDFKLNENILFSAGLKWESKELTKAYNIPGYWIPAFSSLGNTEDTGPYGFGSAIYHSSDESYHIPQSPDKKMPAHNLILTNDIGGYFQTIINAKQFRFHLGLRADNNSLYGTSINPRLATVYRFKNNKGALKLVYGEAFQEPSPRQLFGGWNGRAANPDLKPEKVRNLEFIGMYNLGPVLIDASLFYARYQNVIQEAAINSGERFIYGAEVRTNLLLKNFIYKAPKIRAYAYYSYIKTQSSVYYDHSEIDPEVDKWKEGNSEIGDIAPHKINLGINLPLTKGFNLNVRGNYVSQKLVYLRNAMRADDYKVDEYFTLDGTFSYKFKIISLSLKVKNILDKTYFHSGVGAASAGNNFSTRSLGYQNSLLPQDGRSYMVNVTFQL